MESRRRPNARFVTGVVLAIATCTPRLSVCAEVARPTVSRILALPSPDRTSLMIELTGAVPRASLTSAADTATATIEIGPLASVVPQELVSGPDSTVIASVAVRTYQKAPETFARVVVQLRAACHQKVRVAGRRVYLDLAPVRSAPSASIGTPEASVSSAAAALAAAPGSSSAPAVPATGVPAPVTSGPSVTSARNPAAADPVDQAYRALESDAIRRAKALAAQANVKALEALLQEVLRRDAQLGGKHAEMMSQLLNDIDRYTDEARTLRLKLDGALFRKSPSDTEHKPR